MARNIVIRAMGNGGNVTMNVLISVCESFLVPAKVMLYSLSQQNENLKIYLIYSSLTKEQITELSEYVTNTCHAELFAIYGGDYFKDVPLSKQYGKPELYYRLLAPYILPEEMERILYLDADIIINGSLRDFYDQSFDGAYAAFVMDRFYFCDEVQAQKKKLGLKDEDVYFNSGVVLFNLPEFRRNISFDDIMNFIDEHRESLFYFDQDILNCMLLEHKKLCDLKYNFQAYPFESLKLSDIEKDTVVLHYTDLPKPWNPAYQGTLGYLYWKNAIKAGFVEEYLEYWHEREILAEKAE